MIAHISGTLAQKVPGEIVVDVNGIGYQVFIPLNVFYRLPEIGARIALQIHTHVREDALQLFGFQDAAEKQIFLLLTAVSGIGPRLALNILSGIASEDLARALKESDQVRLVAIPGVGKKLAERMIVELKDKLMTFSSDSACQQIVLRRFTAHARRGFGAGQSRISQDGSRRQCPDRTQAGAILAGRSIEGSAAPDESMTRRPIAWLDKRCP